MPRRPHRATIAVATLAVALLGCEEDPASTDPDGLEEPAEDPEGAPEDGLGDEGPETGDGEPAVEGDGEGQFDPEEDG